MKSENIEICNLLGQVKKQAYDIENVAMWIEQFRKSPDSPALLYNRGAGPFILAVMNLTQCFNVQKIRAKDS